MNSVVAALISIFAASPTVTEQVQPNIIVIVCDDVGYGDVGYLNPEVETPNLERLRTGGVELERFYVAPVCSPTRMSLLTGRYPLRWGMQRSISHPHTLVGLPREQDTLPEMLRRAGYVNSLAAGKWHIGHNYSRSHPIRQGFDSFYGHYSGGTDYNTHISSGELDWHLDFSNVTDEGGQYHTTLITDKALDFVEQNAGSPFFLYLPYYAAHVPNQAPQEWVNRYYTTLGCSIGDTTCLKRAQHLAQVSAMDIQIGRVLDKLNELEIQDETLIWFLSDNGGALGTGASNGTLRKGKAHVYEGGIRVPSIVKYPNGGFQAGVNDALVTALDVMPTLYGILSETATLDTPVRPFDGADMRDALRDISVPEGTHYAFLGRDDTDKASYAVVATVGGVVTWKLVYDNKPQFHDDPLNPPDSSQFDLFNLQTDPGELSPVTNQPIVKADLISRLSIKFLSLWRTEGIGHTHQTAPPEWPGLLENWGFFDIPFTAPARHICYRESGAVPQSIGVLSGGSPVPGTDADAPPEGETGTVFQALGLHAREGLLYALREETPPRIYQIDQSGQVLMLGTVTGMPQNVSIRGGDVRVGAATHDHWFYVFDSVGNQVIEIELQNLTATSIPLQGSTSPDLGDLVWKPQQNTLRSFDSTARRIVDIALDGTVTYGNRQFTPASYQALWRGSNDRLYAYKAVATPIGPGTGLYVLDVAAGTTTLVSTGNAYVDVDGAGPEMP